MKAVVAAFNQEKALVGAFSVITNLRMELSEALITAHHPDGAPQRPLLNLQRERQEEEEEDLRDLVAGHEVGRLLGLDPECLLDGGQHGREVGVLHALGRRHDVSFNI